LLRRQRWARSTGRVGCWAAVWPPRRARPCRRPGWPPCCPSGLSVVWALRVGAAAACRSSRVALAPVAWRPWGLSSPPPGRGADLRVGCDVPLRPDASRARPTWGARLTIRAGPAPWPARYGPCSCFWR